MIIQYLVISIWKRMHLGFASRHSFSYTMTRYWKTYTYTTLLTKKIISMTCSLTKMCWKKDNTCLIYQHIHKRIQKIADNLWPFVCVTNILFCTINVFFINLYPTRRKFKMGFNQEVSIRKSYLIKYRPCLNSSKVNRKTVKHRQNRYP